MSYGPLGVQDHRSRIDKDDIIITIPFYSAAFYSVSDGKEKKKVLESLSNPHRVNVLYRAPFRLPAGF